MKAFITTPIYYPNARPHIGSAYTTILADYLARLYRSCGYEVFFLTGMDEHGEKIQRTAEEKGISPQAFVDEMASCFKKAWEKIGINYDFFIRTSSKEHREGVRNIFNILNEKGWLYKGKYEGYYCVGCERYYTENDLEDGLCPYHKKPVERRSIDAYFFRLSSFRERLLKFYEENPSFLPKTQKEEIINRIKDLGDLCISRPKDQVYWGVELPFDNTHVSYVWVDALFNYATGIGYGKDEASFAKFWPPDIQLMGKDIVWFHTVIWPALLMAVDFPLPRQVIAHGFITVNKAKMSKSLGNVVDPLDLVEKFGSDALRYYLILKMSVTHDSDYTDESFASAYNDEIAANIGNLINRVLVLVKRDTSLPIFSPFPIDTELSKECELVKETLLETVADYSAYELLEDLPKKIITLFSSINAYLSKNEPWKKKGEEKAIILANALEALLFACTMAEPILPVGMKRFREAVGFDKKICDLSPFGKNILALNPQNLTIPKHLYPKLGARPPQ